VSCNPGRRVHARKGHPGHSHACPVGMVLRWAQAVKGKRLDDKKGSAVLINPARSNRTALLAAGQPGGMFLLCLGVNATPAPPLAPTRSPRRRSPRRRLRLRPAPIRAASVAPHPPQQVNESHYQAEQQDSSTGLRSAAPSLLVGRRRTAHYVLPADTRPRPRQRPGPRPGFQRSGFRCR